MTVNIARERSKTLKKEKKKRKNEKKSNNRLFTFTFLYRKFYILLENIYLENLVYMVTFRMVHPIQVTGSTYCGIVFQIMYTSKICKN